MKRKLSAFIISISLLAASLVSATPSSLELYGVVFNDSYNHWSKYYITVLWDKKIMEGYPDYTFKPDSYVTRAELAKVMSTDKWGEELFQGDHHVFSYYDVAYQHYIDRHWATYFILVSSSNGFMKGYPDGTFRPDNNVTRAELAEVIGRNIDESQVDSSKSYSDVNPEDWFYKAALKSSHRGIMEGYPDGTFKPNQYVTRGELAKILAVYHYDYTAPTEEELANPFVWKSGAKEKFEKTVIDMGYVSSSEQIVYEKSHQTNGIGWYGVSDIYGNYIGVANSKTGGLDDYSYIY